MKRKIALLLACALTITSFAGCGKKEETVKRSGEYEIDINECVKELCDYKKIPVELEDKYQVTDDQVTEIANYLLANVGLGYKEITDRKVIKEDDIVLIGYKGFLGEEQFQGGTSSSDIYFDVKNNTDLTNGNKYVDGFNTGLIGATVGEDASSTLTFPDNYQESLAGKEVVFKFDIKGIYEAVTLDTLTDEMVEEKLGEEDMHTKEDYLKEVRNILEAQAANNKYSATIDAVRTYVVTNSKVEVSQDYIDTRYNEYVAAMEADLSSGMTLESYVKTYYNMTLEEAQEEWREVIDEEVRAEILFEYIANKEGLTLDEEGYNSYLQSIISSDTSRFKDAASVYNYYGNNHADEGEAYEKRLYVVTLAIRDVADKAEVTLKPVEDKTEESTEK